MNSTWRKQFRKKMRDMNREVELIYKLQTGRLGNERIRTEVQNIMRRRFPA